MRRACGILQAMTAKNSITKTVQKREELFIQFSEEEMGELGIKAGDKFEVEIGGEGEVILKKMVSLDIDLSEFDKETLVFLIQESIRTQEPVDDVVRKTLEDFLRTHKESGGEKI